MSLPNDLKKQTGINESFTSASVSVHLQPGVFTNRPLNVQAGIQTELTVRKNGRNKDLQYVHKCLLNRPFASP